MCLSIYSSAVYGQAPNLALSSAAIINLSGRNVQLITVIISLSHCFTIVQSWGHMVDLFTPSILFKR